MVKKITTPLAAWNLGTRIVKRLGVRNYGNGSIERIAAKKTFGPWSASHLWNLIRLAERWDRRQAVRAAKQGMSLWDCVLLLPLSPKAGEEVATTRDPGLADRLAVRIRQLEVFFRIHAGGLRGRKFKSAVVGWIRDNEHLFSAGKRRVHRRRLREGAGKRAALLRRDLRQLLDRLRAEVSQARGEELRRLNRQIAAAERSLESLREVMSALDEVAGRSSWYTNAMGVGS